MSNMFFTIKMKFLELLLIVSSTMAIERDPATDHILYFKDKTSGPVGVITTSAGAPVTYTEATNTLNTKLINNEFFMDIISHVARERIPERVVHARGAGAYGYFEVTHDVTNICKANFLNTVGKKTPLIVRFSPTSGDKGSPDLPQNPQGYAAKLYTKEGNFDIVGLNTPMYFYKDPLLFPSFAHANGRNPATNLMDRKTFWDIVTLHPESLHIFLLIFAGRAFPISYKNMPGFSIQTYQVENDQGIKHFVRFHILPDAGIRNFTSEEAANIRAADPDYLTRDLFRQIEIGNFPTWTVYIQIATTNDVKKYGSNLFDVTRVMPLNVFPLFPIGKIVLNKNVKNFFAEIEQLAFNPANLVPGITGGPDKLFESRRLAYRETQNYRLGVNFNKILVNCPFQVKTFTYNRDGVPPVKDNEKDIPNYYPNTYNGPVPYVDNERCDLIDIIEDGSVNNFDQAAELYTNELTDNDRAQLIQNLATDLEQVTKDLQNRAIKILTMIQSDLGARVAAALNTTMCN